MPTRIAVLLTFALLSVCLAGLNGLGQQSPAPTQEKKKHEQTAADLRDRRQQPSQPEAEMLKSDLQRMQTLIYQLQTNLGFVGNTTTPLYHEFELEIALWRIEIDQLERRVKQLEEHKQ